jgi:hypothetical protein
VIGGGVLGALGTYWERIKSTLSGLESVPAPTQLANSGEVTPQLPPVIEGPVVPEAPKPLPPVVQAPTPSPVVTLPPVVTVPDPTTPAAPPVVSEPAPSPEPIPVPAPRPIPVPLTQQEIFARATETKLQKLEDLAASMAQNTRNGSLTDTSNLVSNLNVLIKEAINSNLDFHESFRDRLSNTLNDISIQINYSDRERDLIEELKQNLKTLQDKTSFDQDPARFTFYERCIRRLAHF